MKRFGRFLLLVISITTIFAVFTTGCGGGGGGSSLPADQTSTLKLSESESGQKFIAKLLASNYAELDSRVNSSLRVNSKSLSNIRAVQTVETGVGTARATFGPNDVVNLLGVNFTYTSGHQNYSFRDSLGNLTDNENLLDSFEMESVNLACTISDGYDVVSGVTNGKLILSGFYLGTSFTVKCQNSTFAGSINGKDSVTTVINGNVTVNKSSFPYPVSGSTESGTIIFNGYQYNYSATYNGSNIATISLSGEETITATVNMETGAVVETNQPVSSDVYETGEISGTVTLSIGGMHQPMAGLAVYVNGTSYFALSNAAGNFTIHDVPSNVLNSKPAYEILVNSPKGSASPVTGVVVSPGATTDIGTIIITASPQTGYIILNGSLVSGNAVSSVNGLLVLLTSSADGKIFVTHTDANGNYQFAVMETGNFSIVCPAEDYDFTPSPLQLQISDLDNSVLTLSPITVDGKV